MTQPVEQRVRPSGWWYALGAGLIVVGGLVALVLFISAVVGTVAAVDDFQRVAVPGSRVLTLDEGEHVLYVECRGSTLACPRPAIAVYDPGGDEVPIRASATTETYTWGDRTGERIGSFDAPVAGAYEVVASGEPSVTADTRVAVGDGLFAGLPGRLAVAALVGGALALVGVASLVVVGVRRSRSRRALGPPPGWGSGPGGAPPGWGPPQGPAWGTGP